MNNIDTLQNLVNAQQLRTNQVERLNKEARKAMSELLDAARSYVIAIDNPHLKLGQKEIDRRLMELRGAIRSADAFLYNDDDL